MSASRPASVAFLWHMHQPWYGDARTGRMRLPWVRLHALKDYLDMIAVVEAHPTVHVTFNLVPSLIAQIQAYVDGRTTDDVVELSRREATQLSSDDQVWWLTHGFKCHWPRMVEPHRRYRELLGRRGRSGSAEALAEARAQLSARDWRDLQVWFNLAWCGHTLHRGDELVRGLVAKGQDYTEGDKQALLDHLDTVLAGVLPRYVAAAQQGFIEISTTPYYHPILPLLCHYGDVRAGLPQVRIPPGVHDMPEDAAAQLERGRALCRDLLGLEPAGLWPSEGSVSGPALKLAAEAGFRWAATDEEVLLASVQHVADPTGATGRGYTGADLVQPHQHGELSLFFRHHRASDRIGFDYAGWPAETAVSDLVGILKTTAALGSGVERPVVSVILDGENCWEYYPNNGHDFLARLYQTLDRHKTLQPVTFSEHLALAPPANTLSYIFPGSWINRNFYIWAGHRDDQRAWELLFMTRRALEGAQERVDEATRAQAWEHLYIAEGSDWCWWYGDDHSSDDDAMFDELFRTHLQRVYELLGLDVPEVLFDPIAGRVAPPPIQPPTARFTPILDGRETHFFEWRCAGVCSGAGPAGSMSRQGEVTVLSRVRYGFDLDCVYLAVELAPPTEAAQEAAEWRLELEWAAGGRISRLTVPRPHRAGRCAVPVERLPQANGRSEAEVVIAQFVELALPIAALPAAAGETAELVVSVSHQGQTVERWPERGSYEFTVPDEDDWVRGWMV